MKVAEHYYSVVVDGLLSMASGRNANRQVLFQTDGITELEITIDESVIEAIRKSPAPAKVSRAVAETLIDACLRRGHSFF